MAKPKQYQHFGEVLRAVMDERGLTAYRLAQISGVTSTAIGKVLIGRFSPSFDAMRRIASALDLRLDWINDQLPPVELPDPPPVKTAGRKKRTEMR